MKKISHFLCGTENEWLASFNCLIIYAAIPIYYLKWMEKCVTLFAFYGVYVKFSFSFFTSVLSICANNRVWKHEIAVSVAFCRISKHAARLVLLVSWPCSLEPSVQARLLMLNGWVIRFIFSTSFCVQRSVKGHRIIYSHYKAVVHMAPLMVCF